MRLKAIPLWEQYIEKLVLGLLLLLLMFVIVWEIISVPNNQDVRIGDGSRTLAPGEINAALLERASQIRALQGDEQPPHPGLDLTPLENEKPIAPELARIIQGGVSGGTSLARTAPTVASAIMPSGKRERAIWYEPSLPAVAMQSSVQLFHDELTDDARAEFASEFDALLGVDQNEVNWTIPVGVIDMTAVRAEFSGSDDSRDSIPPYWRDETYPIVDVRFERETLLADGGWSDAQEVMPLLGALTFRDDVEDYESGALGMEEDDLKDASLELRDQLLDSLAVPKLQTDILQPRFYDTEFAVAADFLRNPEGASASGEIDLAIIKAEERFYRMSTQLEQMRVELEKLGGELDPPSGDQNRGSGQDSGRGGRGGRGGGSGSGGGGNGGVSGGGGGRTAGRGGGGGQNSGQDSANDKARIRMTKELRSMEEALERQLAVLPEDHPLRTGATGEALASRMVDVDGDETIFVWAHDPTVKGGETYRYRCTAEFYNPFFTRDFQLQPQQQELALQPAMSTLESDWSDPVTIDSGVKYFVTDASIGANGELGKVTIEVFKSEAGRQWSYEFDLQPGDLLGSERPRNSSGETKMIDFATDYMLVDVVPVSDSESAEGVGVLLQRVGDAEWICRYPDVDRDDSARAALELDVRRAESADAAAGTTATDG